MSNQTYFLPRRDFPAPENLMETLISSEKLKNVGLWLQRFPLWVWNEKKKVGEPDLRTKIKPLSKGRLAIPQKFFPMLEYKNYFDRFGAMTRSMSSQDLNTLVWDGKVSWRLVVGLGSESVYETSISIHRSYSVPIIPGSAVKGVVHTYAEMSEGQLTDKARNDIFGRSEEAGKVMFFDALPIIESNKDFLVLDVMNVHYPDYYQRKPPEPPGDWMNPNPIFFLAVEGIKFRFAVTSRSRALAEEAMNLLKQAVHKVGVGAKTSAGYGYFEQ